MMLRGSIGNMISDAPKDLRVLGLANIPSIGFPRTFYIYVYSEDYDEVPDDQEPPEIEPYRYTVKKNDA